MYKTLFRFHLGIILSLLLCAGCSQRYTRLKKVRAPKKTVGLIPERIKKDPPTLLQARYYLPVCALTDSLLTTSVKRVDCPGPLESETKTSPLAPGYAPTTDTTIVQPDNTKAVRLNRSNWKEAAATCFQIIFLLLVAACLIGGIALAIGAAIEFAPLLFLKQYIWATVAAFILFVLFVAGGTVLLAGGYTAFQEMKAGITTPINGVKILLGEIRRIFSLKQWRKRQLHNALASTILGSVALLCTQVAVYLSGIYSLLLALAFFFGVTALYFLLKAGLSKLFF